MLRVGLVVLAALLSLVLLPRLFTPQPTAIQDLHGLQSGDAIIYRDKPVADVLADIERLTGFRAVVFPEIGGRRYTGALTIGRDGERAVAALASAMGLELRNAGPHRALVDPVPK